MGAAKYFGASEGSASEDHFANNFSRYHANLLEERSQKIDDLPVLVTYWSGTLPITHLPASEAHPSSSK